MNIVEAKGLTKDFHLGKTLIHALKCVDIAIKEREFLAIAGPSGSGNWDEYWYPIQIPW